MHVALDGFAEAAEQVEAIRHLRGLGCARTDGARILVRAVPCDHCEVGEGAQPGSDDLGGALGQEIDRSTALQVNDEGAVGAALAQGEVVDPDDRGQWGVLCGWHCAQQPQEGVPTGGHLQVGGKPRTSRAPGNTADGTQGLGQAWGTPSPQGRQLREALGEGTLGAGRRVTPEAAHPQAYVHRPVGDGKVTELAHIAAMDARRQLPTGRAALTDVGGASLNEQRSVGAPSGQ
jgi:hypothetical protein